MHRCFNCGREYEGKFCPDCGAAWQEEKTCPSCGAKLGGETRFCTECGYAFVNTPAASQGAAAGGGFKSLAGRVYPFLRYIPLSLFALFSLLLFAFFAAPVAVMPIEGFSESYGSVYTLNALKELLPEICGTVVALIVFAAISLAAAAAGLYLLFSPTNKYRGLKVAALSVKLHELFSYIACALLLIFFITGCVLCGQLSALDEGMGLVAAGACPVLIIVFSIIFLLFAAAAITLKILSGKKFPEFTAAEKAAEESFIASENSRREIFYATHAEPVAPAKPDIAYPPYSKEAIGIAKRKRFNILNVLLFVVIEFGWAIVFFGFPTISESDGTYLISVPVIVAALLCVFGELLPVRRIKAKRILGRAKLRLTNFLFFVLVCFNVFVALIMTGENRKFTAIETVFLILYYAAGIAFIVINCGALRTIRKIKKGKSEMSAEEFIADVQATAAAREERAPALAEYRKQLRAYRRARSRYKAAKE